ncbi:hypothetical protein L9F63_013921, partial [Diploptera punctata]
PHLSETRYRTSLRAITPRIFLRIKSVEKVWHSVFPWSRGLIVSVRNLTGSIPVLPFFYGMPTHFRLDSNLVDPFFAHRGPQTSCNLISFSGNTLSLLSTSSEFISPRMIMYIPEIHYLITEFLY